MLIIANWEQEGRSRVVAPPDYRIGRTGHATAIPRPRAISRNMTSLGLGHEIHLAA